MSDKSQWVGGCLLCVVLFVGGCWCNEPSPRVPKPDYTVIEGKDSTKAVEVRIIE